MIRTHITSISINVLALACLYMGNASAAVPSQTPSTQSPSFLLNEEKFCKNLGRITYKAAQMRDAKATPDEVKDSVTLQTMTMRPDTREMMIGVVDAIFDPSMKGHSPEEHSLNMYSNCMGHTDPAITYTQNLRPGAPKVADHTTAVSDSPPVLSTH